jgi:hypothetical protein
VSTSATGSLAIYVEDEYTYFVASQPRVANATIVISDPQNNGVTIATGTLFWFSSASGLDYSSVA